MLFFARVLRRLELFAKLGSILCHHFLECSVNKMAAAGSFSSQYRVLFTSIMSTRRCGAPVLEEFRMLDNWLLVASNLNVGQHLLM